jgi:hypothetical protein
MSTIRLSYLQGRSPLSGQHNREPSSSPAQWTNTVHDITGTCDRRPPAPAVERFHCRSRFGVPEYRPDLHRASLADSQVQIITNSPNRSYGGCRVANE